MEIKDIKKKYSDDELEAIYSLGLLFIENGELLKARNIFEGLIEINNLFLSGYIGMIYIEMDSGNIQDAIKYCQKALEISPNSYPVILMYVSCLLSTGDSNKAGIYLGEIADAIEDKLITNYDIIRFYRSQIIRYQNEDNIRNIES